MLSEKDVQDVWAAPHDAAWVEMILERALNYRSWVRVLHEDLDVPDEVVARVAAVHPGSVRRWRSFDPGVGEPRQAQAQAIESLRRIALVLVTSGVFWDLKGVGAWLQAGRAALDWRAPYEVLADDETGFDRVLQEARRFVGPGAGSAGASVPSGQSGSNRAMVAGFGPPRRET